MSTVQSDSFVTLHYCLRDPDQRVVVSTFSNQPATFSLGRGEMAPAMEQCLIGLPIGQRSRFELAAGAVFGPRNPDMIQRIKHSLLEEHHVKDGTYSLGDIIEFPTPDGSNTFAGMVCELGADWVALDFNHPLAGRSLSFEVHIIGILL